MRAKDETKEQLILATALGMIARVGLAGLRMSDLAKEAGMATGTVYIYFHDKDSLIRKIYTDLMRKTTVDLLKGVPENNPTKVKIQQLCFNYLRELMEHPEYSAFFEQYFRSPFYRETDLEAATERTVLQPIFDLVQQGQEERIIKDLPTELLVTLVCGMLSELVKTAQYEGRLVTDEEWKHTFTVIWDGIKS